jgi:MoxR-like ATPase
VYLLTTVAFADEISNINREELNNYILEYLETSA